MARQTKADLILRIDALNAGINVLTEYHDRDAEVLESREVEITELKARLDGMRATNSEKIQKLNRMVNDKIGLDQEIKGLRSENRSLSRYTDNMSTVHQKLMTAIDTIQATSVNGSTPCGTGLMSGGELSNEAARYHQLLNHLRNIINS